MLLKLILPIAFILIPFYFIQTNDLFTQIRNGGISIKSMDLACSPIITNSISHETFIIDNIAYPTYIPQSLNKSLNFACINKNRQSKIILYWNKLNRNPGFHFGIGKDEIFKERKCPVTNCEVTNDRSRLNESDLILFSLWDKIGELPLWRTDRQRWVFVLHESPQRKLHVENRGTKANKLKKFNGLFNLSATYGLNSNYTPSYSGRFNVKWEFNNDFDVDKNFMAKKTKMVFQVSSNCNPPGGRHIYIAELKKYIQVDIYGKCGTPCSNLNDTWGKADCKLALISQYKFYLAFENTICNKYITEKFFGILKYDIIPVVYGAGPYDVHIPKSGYINAFDFESPRDLAKFMIKISSNQTLYNSYFKWKQFIKHGPYISYSQICEMCIQLNLEQYYGMKHSVIKDMEKFWNKKKECKILDDKTFKLRALKIRHH